MEASGSLVSLISDAVRTAQRQSSIMRGVPGVGQRLGLAPYGNAATPNESPDPHAALDAGMAHAPEGIAAEIMAQRMAAAQMAHMALRRRPPPPFGGPLHDPSAPLTDPAYYHAGAR